ncbi:hypothetical protein RSK20926_13159 [Roseobacter sp. SK209-2-6]|uniref:hypothetical protein n=1 Tax=Roseobacter sp. SK209-2-6 TaxID=388739 RepID=UPI0000F3C604|nr:hypothetical protein [Roseobacter sp. SK209-2-6]EBA18673.1 hypothetical protein RSK20926_13159 [Roseobacter sp. SK209-2-6]
MAPSGDKNDPVKRVAKDVETLHKRITYYLKTVWKRVRGLLAPLRNFLKKILKVVKKIVATVGKKAVDTLVKAATKLLDLFDRVEALLKTMFLLGKRILNTIKKEADKTKLVRTLKTVIRKYVQAMRKVFGWVNEIWRELDILNRALMILDTFRGVLQIIFRWIAEVAVVLNTLKRAKQLLKSVWKALKKEIKDAIKLGKEVAKMPVPKPG